MKHSVNKETNFDIFFKNRDALIAELMSGKITKREYIHKNYNHIKNTGAKPFATIDSFEKGIYNYQYYNMMAKYYSMLAAEEKIRTRQLVFYKNYLDECNNFYNEKDKTTFRLLRFLKFKNVESYFISMESLALKDVLFEIMLKDYDYAILHSKSLWLLNVLKKENVFSDKTKKSVIDYYVNDKY